MTEIDQYVGRFKSFYRVTVVVRVTADLDSKQAQVAQLKANLGNVKLTMDRARTRESLR